MSTNNSGLSKSELDKGLDRLTAAAKAPSRRAELFQKAESGEITEAEREELVKSIASPSLATRALEKMQGNDVIEKSLEVSDFLRESNNAQVAALTTLADSLEKSQKSEQDFRIAAAQTLVGLAKSINAQNEVITQQGALLKSVAETMGVIAKQPARAPKSQGVTPQPAAAQPLNKSFAGGAEEGTLTKSMILDTMEDMLHKGMNVVAGEDIVHASTKYESENLITPGMLAAVQQHRGGGSKAA